MEGGAVNVKKYFVTFNEEDGQEFNEYDLREIVQEQFNGIKTKGEQEDVLNEIAALEVDEEYTYFNDYVKRYDLKVRRIA